jgi:hypothetical protein
MGFATAEGDAFDGFITIRYVKHCNNQVAKKTVVWLSPVVSPLAYEE